MPRGLIPKRFFCVVSLTLFASACFLSPVFADYKATVSKHVKCMDTYDADKEKCVKILGKSYSKPTGSKAAENLYKLGEACYLKAMDDLDECREPDILKKFITDKKWRKANRKALDALADKFEAMDDKCVKAAEGNFGKCGGIKKEKKQRKCIASANKKLKKCIKKAEKTFLKGLKKLKPPK